MSDVMEVEGHAVACRRIKVKSIGGALTVAGLALPTRWVEALEHNQQIASCCRHPENHELEAFYSSAEDQAKGVPDIYVFHCTCGRRHRRFCVGGSNPETGEGMRLYWG
jgi:hypothetical protein